MGAVCTTKANRRFNEDRRHRQNIIPPLPSPRLSANTQISLAESGIDNTNDAHALFEQIRNAPDDSNLIIINDLNISANAPDRDDLCFLDYNKSHTSFSLMLSHQGLSNDMMLEQHTPLQSIGDDIDTIDICHPPQDIMSIGDEIELIPKYNCLHGIIRFIGEIADKEGIFYGIELNINKGSDDVYHFRKLCNGINDFSVHQDDGWINNVCYFKTDEYEALFVRKEQIYRILRVNYDNPRIAIHSDVYVSKYNCNGIVKYIGKPQFENDENMHLIYYGVELHKRMDGNTNNIGTFHGQCCFKQCKHGHGVFVDSTELSYLIVPSRYNLFIHGYSESKCINIASGIIRLISGYDHSIAMRLTSHIGDNVICKKYEPFDIDNNICGPAVTTRYSGSNTHNTEFVTVVAGYYQFVKSSTIDSGDYNTPWVNKTEFQIIQLDNGDRERIYRTITCDNEIPLMKDYKSIRMRFRHDIHADDVELCDHTQILDHIARVYGVSVPEIKTELEKYDIELYGLRY